MTTPLRRTSPKRRTKRALRDSMPEVLEARIAPAFMGAYSGVGNNTLTLQGTVGDDIAIITASGTSIAVNDGDPVTPATYSLVGVTTVNVLGSTGNDVVTIDLINGNPFLAQTFNFNGGGDLGDQFVVHGTNTSQLAWNPSATTMHTGTVTATNPLGVNYGYTGAPAGVKFDTAVSVVATTPAGSDDFTEGAFSGLGELVGTVSGKAQRATFAGVTALTVDLGLNDVAPTANSYTVNALAGPLLQNLTVNTGPGNDTVTLNASVTSLNLPTAGGTATFNLGGGTGDTFQTNFDGNVTLTATQLSYSTGAGPFVPAGTAAISGVENATLNGGAAANIFNVSGITGAVTVNTGAGLGDSTTVTGASIFDITTGGTFNLTGSSGHNTFTLAGAGTGTATGGIGADDFTVTNLTGNATITGGGGANSIIDAGDADYTLSDATLTKTIASVTQTLTLSGIQTADLTGGASGNSFGVTGFTGAVTLTGLGGADTFTVATGTSSVTARGGDGNDTFNITGNGTLNLDGGNNDDTFTVAGSGALTLLGGSGTNSYTVSAYTGTGSITGGANSDTLIAVGNVDYTLSNTLLTRSGLADLTLSGIESVDLTGGASGNSFGVTGFTGSVTLTGLGGGDSFTVATGTTSVTARGGDGNDIFNVTGDGTLNLDGGNNDDTFTVAGSGALTLVGGDGTNSYTVSGYTGTGSITGGVDGDTLIAAGNTAYTLSDLLLTRAGLGDLTLSGIESAHLTGTAGGDTFGVHGFAGSVVLDGLAGNNSFIVSGANSVTANGGADDDTFDITGNGTLIIDGGDGNNTYTIAGTGALTATGGTGTDNFTVSGFSGTGSITGGGGAGIDTIIAVGDNSFTVTASSFGRTGATTSTQTISGIESVDLTGSANVNTFNVSGLTGTVKLTGNGGDDIFTVTGNGTINATGGADNDTFDLTSDGSIIVDGGDGNNSYTLAGAATLTATGGTGNDSYQVSAFTGSGTIAAGGGIDQITATNDLNFTLSNTALVRDDGVNPPSTLTFNGSLEVANLTGGSGDNSFDATDFAGEVTLTGLGGTDSFTTTVASKVTAIGGAGNDTFNIASSGLMTLTGGDGANTFTIGGAGTLAATSGTGNDSYTLSAFTGSGSIDAGTQAGDLDSLTAAGDVNYTLTGTTFTRGTSVVTLGGTIETASLTGGAGANTFNVSAFPGKVTLSGLGGNDSFTVSGSSDVTADGGDNDDTFDITGNGVIAIIGGEGNNTSTIAGSGTLTATGGTGDDTFTVTAYTGSGSINGGAGGTNKIVAVNDVNFDLSDGLLKRSGGTEGPFADITLTNVNAADLTGGGSANVFTVAGFAGTASLSGLALNDTFTISTSGTVTANGGDGNDSFSVITTTSAIIVGGAGLDTGSINAGTMNVSGGDDADSFTIVGPGGLTADGGLDNDTFTVSDYTGNGTIDGGAGHDTIIAITEANFTLSNTSLSRIALGVGGASLGTIGLQRLEVATLTGVDGANTFTVTNWNSDPTSVLTLNGGKGNDTFTVAGVIDLTVNGGDGDDTINVTSTTKAAVNGENGNDSGSIAAGQMIYNGGDDNDSFAFAGTGSLIANGGNGNDSFDVSLYNGATHTINGDGGINTIAATNDANFILKTLGTTGTLDRSIVTSGLEATLLQIHFSNITVANLTGGASSNSFTISDWVGTGKLDGGASGTDTVIAVKDTNFLVTDARIATAKLVSPTKPTVVFHPYAVDYVSTLTLPGAAKTGFDMELAHINKAALTGGASQNLIDAGQFSGATVLTGMANVDTLIAGKGNSVLKGFDGTNGQVVATGRLRGRPTNVAKDHDHYYVQTNANGVTYEIQATTRAGNTISFRDAGVGVQYTLPTVGRLNVFGNFITHPTDGLETQTVAGANATATVVKLTNGYLQHLEGSGGDDTLKGNNLLNTIWGGRGKDTLIAVGLDGLFGGTDGTDIYVNKFPAFNFRRDPYRTNVAREAVFFVVDLLKTYGVGTSAVASFTYAPAVTYYGAAAIGGPSAAGVGAGEAIYELRNLPPQV